ncbi:MAG: hypothetical protein PWQ77_560 [Kosmotogales bacterium]|nr:hypothetical protein [Kosmotogales bacterium]
MENTNKKLEILCINVNSEYFSSVRRDNVVMSYSKNIQDLKTDKYDILIYNHAFDNQSEIDKLKKMNIDGNSVIFVSKIPFEHSKKDLKRIGINDYHEFDLEKEDDRNNFLELFKKIITEKMEYKNTSIFKKISDKFKNNFDEKAIEDILKNLCVEYGIRNSSALFKKSENDLIFISLDETRFDQSSNKKQFEISLFNLTKKMAETTRENVVLLNQSKIREIYGENNFFDDVASDEILKINFLKFRKKFYGAIFFIIDDKTQSDSFITNLLDFFSDQISIHNEKKFLYEEIKIGSSKIKALHNVALKIEKGDSEFEVIKLGEEAIRSILKYDHYTFDIVEGDVFVVKADSFEGGVNISNYSLDEPGIATKVFKTKKPYLSNDVQNDPEADPTSKLFGSAMTLPIGNIGIFQAISYQKNAFSDLDVEFTELVISSIGEVIERMRKESEIKYLSYHDSLTGLLNRTFLSKEYNSIDRFKKLPMSVILGDINGLKVINDAFGHSFGDKLLKKFSDIFNNCCRNTDIIIRFGGDEFLFFLPGITEDQAIKIVNRIEKECEKVEDLPIPLSIAMGISVKNEKNQKISELIKNAENEMYKKKSIYGLIARKKIISILKEKADEVSKAKGKNLHFIKELSLKMAEKLNFTKEQKQLLEKYIDLHEIGEITMDRNINLKSEENYTEEDWGIALRHPVKGYSIARANDETVNIAEDILSHHEKWDGSGYPRGISGEKIPLNARIVSIAEHYEKGLLGRSYLNPVNKDKILSDIKEKSGSSFDPELVKIFAEIV